MKFRQLDRIIELVPGERISAVRQLRSDEDYLRDHFPLFPVMPGVLMLEALFQASCWLIRATENFENSFLMLSEARNIKFAGFMEPGHVLEVSAEIVKIESESATIKATGSRGDVVAVSGRLIISKTNLGKKDESLSPLDEYMKDFMRKEMGRLTAANS